MQHFRPDCPNAVFVSAACAVVPPRLPAGAADYPSILIVVDAPADIDDATLAAIDDLGRLVTDRYDREIGGERYLANFAELIHRDGLWEARRFTWTSIPASGSFEAAVAELDRLFDFGGTSSPKP